jgi:hypothetical protein
MLSSVAADRGRQAGSAPPKERVRSGEVCATVAKQAAVSEKKIRAVTEIRREDPDAYQRIVTR